MARRTTTILLTLLLAACGPKKTDGQTAHPLTTTLVQDGDASFDLEIAYQQRPEGQVQLLLAMKPKGSEETEKLSIDVALEGFVLTEGVTDWEGFVPPRQPQKHQLTVRALPDVEHAMLTVTVRRSMDSEVLASRELPFRVTGDVVSPE